jgi:hypothetical protein
MEQYLLDKLACARYSEPANAHKSLFLKEYSIFTAAPQLNKQAPNPATASLGAAGIAAHPPSGRDPFGGKRKSPWLANGKSVKP